MNKKRTAIIRILYQDRKIIAYHWIDVRPPKINELVDRINSLIQLEKYVYQKRGAIKKFEGVWFSWLSYYDIT